MINRERYTSSFQPNPGKGKICDLCINQSEKPQDSDFPCKLVTINGHRISGPKLVRFSNGREGCSGAVPRKFGIRQVKIA